VVNSTTILDPEQKVVEDNGCVWMAADPVTPSGIAAKDAALTELKAHKVLNDRIKVKMARCKLRFIQSGLRRRAKINRLAR